MGLGAQGPVPGDMGTSAWGHGARCLETQSSALADTVVGMQGWVPGEFGSQHLRLSQLTHTLWPLQPRTPTLSPAELRGSLHPHTRLCPSSPTAGPCSSWPSPLQGWAVGLLHGDGTRAPQGCC